jgi:hypothetical protein
MGSDRSNQPRCISMKMLHSLILLLAVAPFAQAQQNLVPNGNFSAVNGQLPAGWDTYEGAMELAPASPDGHALSLSPWGRLGTQVNNQPLVLGDTYDLSFIGAALQTAWPSERLLVRLIDTTTNDTLLQTDIRQSFIANGSFDSFNGNLPAAWETHEGYMEPIVRAGNDKGLLLSPFGRIGQRFTEPLIAGATYTVKFEASSPQPQAPPDELLIRVIDTTNDQRIASKSLYAGAGGVLGANWQQYSVTFVVPKANGGHPWWLHITNRLGVSAIDNVSLTSFTGSLDASWKTFSDSFKVGPGNAGHNWWLYINNYGGVAYIDNLLLTHRPRAPLGKPIVGYFNSAVFDSEPSKPKILREYGWLDGYDPSTLDDDIATRTKAGGFNLAWISGLDQPSDAQQLPIAVNHGLRSQLIVSGQQPQDTWFFSPQLNWPALADAPQVDDLISKFKQSPSAYSYLIIDEPGAGRFAQLAAIASHFRQQDPARLININLWPPSQGNLFDDAGIQSVDYSEYLDNFISYLKPDVLSYDFYNLYAKANLLTNGDFSLFSGTVPTSWTTYENWMEPTTSSPDGHGLTLSPWGKLGQQVTSAPLQAGKTYTLSFLAASTQPAFPAQELLVRVIDADNNVTLAQMDITSGMNINWQPYSLTFKVPSTSQGHKWWVLINNYGGVANIDNVWFSEVYDESNYLKNLKLFAEKSKSTGIPFINVVQGLTLGWSGMQVNWRVPNKQELRFLANSTLAFGAQGILYFNYRGLIGGPSTGGLAPYPDGTPTGIYSALATINPRFERIATQLQQLPWIGTYTSGYSTPPPGMAMLPTTGIPFRVDGAPILGAFSGGDALQGALVGLFGGNGTSAATAQVAFVQNMDYSAARALTITAPSNIKIAIFNADTGIWAQQTGNSKLVLLEPGEGVLVRRQ